MKRMILVIAIVCLLVSSNVLALTNEERIQMLRDRFSKGEISKEAYKRLLKKYGEETNSKTEEAKSGIGEMIRVDSDESRAQTGNQLILQMRSEGSWRGAVVGCDKLSGTDKIPLKLGCFISRDPAGALKLFVRFRDKDGEVFQALLHGYLKKVKSPGETIEVTIASEKLEYVMDCGVVENLLPDSPIVLHSFLITHRKPFSETLVMDNITLNGKLIEDFESGRNWKVRQSSPEFHCKLSIGKAEERVAGFLSRDKLVLEGKPTVYGNFIGNSAHLRDENNDGVPDNWYVDEAKYMPRYSDGSLYSDPKNFSGECRVEERGIEGLPGVTIVADEGKWCGIDTVVKKIRPNTPYTISFWSRQSSPECLTISIFGRSLVTNMFKYNPDHWQRDSETVYSGSYSGDVPIGFHVSGGQTASISDVRLYEGNSPIGYDSAEIRTLYYSQWYISPDSVSPVNFMLENNFYGKPPPVKYIIDLPVEVKLSSHWFQHGWGNSKSANWYMKEASSWDRSTISRDGREYNRYCFTYRRVRNPFFIGVYGKGGKNKCRDKYEGMLGGYCGPTHLRLFLTTALESQPEEELAGYYHAEWAGGKQPERKITFKVVRIPKVPPPKRLRMLPSVQALDIFFAPEMAELGRRIGGTGIYGGILSDPERKTVVEVLKKAGLTDISYFCNIPNYHSSPEVYGVGLDGERATGVPGRASWPAPGYCLSYRDGEHWKKIMSDRPQLAVSNEVNHLVMDDYQYSNCFCDKCKASFREYLAKYTKLPYKEPESFMKKLGSDPEYESLWKDFQCWLYGKVIGDMKKELREFAREKGSDANIIIDSSSVPYGHAITHDFAFETLHQNMDAWTGQYYINCYWPICYGDPGNLADNIADRYRRTGKYPVKMCPLLAAGLIYMHPACAIDPPQQHKYQILEAAMCCPITGYSLYGEMELCDYYYSALANRMLFPYEDILIDGKMIANIKVVSDTKRSRARGKRLGKDILLLVSDYSTYGPEETKLRVKLALSLKVLQDVETKEKIRAEGDGAFIMNLKDGRRARLFQGTI